MEGFPEVVECVVVAASSGIYKKQSRQVTHLQSGLVVTSSDQFNKVENLTTVQVEELVLKLNTSPVLNPSISTSTPGKFKHLLYYPGQSASIVNKDL